MLPGAASLLRLAAIDAPIVRRRGSGIAFFAAKVLRGRLSMQVIERRRSPLEDWGGRLKDRLVAACSIGGGSMSSCVLERCRRHQFLWIEDEETGAFLFLLGRGRVHHVGEEVQCVHTGGSCRSVRIGRLRTRGIRDLIPRGTLSAVLSEMWTYANFGLSLYPSYLESGFDDAATLGGVIEVVPVIQQRRRNVKLERLELGLAKARSVIREAIRNKDNRPPLTDKDYVPVGPVYRNAYAFHRSYLEMEKLFKIYVYEEGEPPVFHDGPCRSIYSTEGRFIYAMEMENRMRTTDPELAHVFFLPFSIVKMVKMIYEPNSHDMSPLRRTVFDYIDVLSTKYPYWNRSLGADHFMLSCHDWGPYVSSADGHLFSNSIRVLCNANTSEGFNPSKDVSLPEINLRSDVIDKHVVGGPSASGRPILAFFAGGDHGPVRPVLLEHWKGKDADVQVSEYLPQGVSYIDRMRQSKFCLCPSGYEVASPRVVEAIYLECVPVVIGDDYVLPFSDVLNWPAFSVRVAVPDIPNLKRILAGVSPRQYIRMQRRVRIVRRHFMVNGPPQRFDVFHMILHSIWLRRLNIRLHGED